MAKGILERLENDIVLGDGGYIVELERRGYVIAGPFTPELALTHPDAIREMHSEFMSAVAEVLQVMAFYGSREKLATVGFADKTFEINQAATRLAKAAAGEVALVAGDLSATWKWDANSPSARALVAGMFDEQIEAQEGVDFFIGAYDRCSKQQKTELNVLRAGNRSLPRYATGTNGGIFRYGSDCKPEYRAQRAAHCKSQPGSQPLDVPFH